MLQCHQANSNRLCSTYMRKWRGHCVRTGTNPNSPAVSETLLVPAVSKQSRPEGDQRINICKHGNVQGKLAIQLIRRPVVVFNSSELGNLSSGTRLVTIPVESECGLFHTGILTSLLTINHPTTPSAHITSSGCITCYPILWII